MRVGEVGGPTGIEPKKKERGKELTTVLTRDLIFFLFIYISALLKRSKKFFFFPISFN